MCSIESSRIKEEMLRATTSVREACPTGHHAPTIYAPATLEVLLKEGKVLFSGSLRNILLLPASHPLELDIKAWWGRIHAEDVDALRTTFQELCSGRQNQVEEVFRIARYDSCYAWLLLHGTVTEMQNGIVTKAACTVMDVSRLRVNPRFQFNVHEDVASKGYQAMLDHSPDMMARMDRELFPLYVNPMLDRYLSVKHDQLGGESAESVGLEDGHLAFLRRNVVKVFDTGEWIREVTVFKTKLRGEVTGEFSFWPEFDENGKVVSVLTQLRDLSELVHSEQAVRLNEKRLEALYQLSGMGDDPEEDVWRFVVESITQLTGSAKGYLFRPGKDDMTRGRMLWSESHYGVYEETDLVCDRIPTDCLLHYNASLEGLAPNILNGNGQDPVVSAFGGKLKVMSFMYAPVYEGKRLICVAAVCNKGVDYDDADLQQLQLFLKGAWHTLRRREFVSALRHAKDTAEQANLAKNKFLANVSHELRTPLNGMLGMLQLLDISKLSKQQREYVRLAEQSGTSLMRVLSDILDFSRMESKKLELHPAPFNIKDTIKSTVGMFRTETDKRGLTLDLFMDEAIPPSLIGDDARIRQVLFNLVGNAMKFTGAGGIVVECSLLPQTRTDKAWVYLAVNDTGIGIPEDKHDAIFDAFMQVDDTRTRKYPGTGLGLGIVKQLCLLMDGSITVESLEAGGTAMHCSLPLTIHNPDVPAKRARVFDNAPRQEIRLDVLAVEDDPVGRFCLKAFTQKAGHRVVCVENGKQAIEALQIHPFHCVLTDMQMPEMDGLELIRRIRGGDFEDIPPTEAVRELIAKELLLEAMPHADIRQIPVPRDIVATVISAHAMKGDRERFLKAGMDFYLSKPLVLKEFLRLFDQVGERLSAANAAVRSTATQ